LTKFAEPFGPARNERGPLKPEVRAEIDADIATMLSEFERGPELVADPGELVIGEEAEKLSVHPRERVEQKRFLSACEIASLAPSVVPWVAKPWAAASALTEVEGKIKAAGKTTWVMHLCRAVLDGLPFMGEPTQRSPVVYLTEQPLTSFREALRRADLLERHDFRVLARLNALGLTWPETVVAATAECADTGARLLVVDTLSPFAGLEGEAENSAGGAQAAIAPLLEAAHRDNLAVIVVRHSRKSGGEVGESGRGSAAFGGAVDLIVSLRRREGNAPRSQRVIYTLGRFDETPEDLVIDLTDEGFVALGSAEDVGGEAVRTAMFASLDGSALSETELLEAVEAELGRTVGRSALLRVRDEERRKGTLHRVGGGKRGDPYRYQVDAPENVSVQPSLLGEQKETGGSDERAAGA
jgi:hypothetical protein